MSVTGAGAILRDYFEWEVVVNNRESILRATEIEARFKISFWDGLILQAAEKAGAGVLYTEDLSHGQMYGPVRVVNPFLAMR
jgi:predicted nucleic acid-binding protein